MGSGNLHLEATLINRIASTWTRGSSFRQVGNEQHDGHPDSLHGDPDTFRDRPPPGGTTLISGCCRTHTRPLTGDCLGSRGQIHFPSRRPCSGCSPGAPAGRPAGSTAEDTRSSLDAVRALGARPSEFQDGVLDSHSRRHAPPGTRSSIDCGNSGTTARLLTGLLAGWLDPADAAGVRLTGDASLSSRPMNRVVDPLRAMGADITYVGTEGRLPLLVRGAALPGCAPRAEGAFGPGQVGPAAGRACSPRGEPPSRGGGRPRDHTELLLAIDGRVL